MCNEHIMVYLTPGMCNEHIIVYLTRWYKLQP